MAAVSAEGSTVCVLIRRLNSSCSRSTALVVRADRHWLSGKRVKVNSRSPASSRLSATRAAFQPPFADERLATRLDLLWCAGVDHIVVVGRDFLMQSLRSMCQKVAVLVHGAALHQCIRPDQAECLLQPCCTVDDDEARR